MCDSSSSDDDSSSDYGDYSDDIDNPEVINIGPDDPLVIEVCKGEANKVVEGDNEGEKAVKEIRCGEC